MLQERIPEKKRALVQVDRQRVVEAVPDFAEFMTGAELFDSTRRLVKENWHMVQQDRLEWKILGESTEGKKIDLLRVGNGKKKFMWVGTPHPNEPVGTLAIDFMSRYLCEHPEELEAG